MWANSTQQSPSTWQRLKLAIAAGAGLVGYAFGTAYGAGSVGEHLKITGKVVDTVAALKNLSKNGNPWCFVTGYYAAGDGGGGQYHYDSSDTTTADNGGTVIVATDGGRWKLVYGSFVSTRQFGVKADWNGTTGTDDTTAWQNALNWVQTATDPATYGSNSPWLGKSFHLYHPPGRSKITATLTATKRFTLRGDPHPEYSSGSGIFMATANLPTIQVTPDAAGMTFTIEHMVFDGKTVNGTGDTIVVKAPVSGPGANSVRIMNNFFGAPQRYAIVVEQGDDLRIEGNTFDVAAGVSDQAAIVLGANSAAKKVTNGRIFGNNFFQQSVRAILVFNVDGLQVCGNRQYTDTSITTLFLVDALNSLPLMAKNITVSDNDVKYCSTLLGASAAGGTVDGITVKDNIGSNLGRAGAETQSCIQLSGTVTRLSVRGNVVSGAWGTKSFYDDSGATVSGDVTENHVEATSGTGRLILGATTTGLIANNRLKGIATPTLSQRWFTSGNAVAPGTIAAGGTFTFNLTVPGAIASDEVLISSPATFWLAPLGIVQRAYVSAANTVAVEYTNVTGAGIACAAHDIGILVNRRSGP